MTALPAAGYYTNPARTNGEAKQALDDTLAFIRQMLGGNTNAVPSGTGYALTISAGAVTPTMGAHTIDTEAAAASDDLDTIAQTNIPDGGLLLITAANAGRVVTVRHNIGGTGKVLTNTAANMALAIGTWLLLQRQGTSWQEITRFYGTAAELASYLGVVAGTGIRERLTAARTYYVRGDGSDSNTGLVNSAGGAFATLNKAMQTIARTLDLAQYDVTIKLANTHDQTATFTLLPYVTGGGIVIVEGDTVTPSNTKIATTSADAVVSFGSAPFVGTNIFRLRKLQIQCTTSGIGLNLRGPVVVELDDVRWGACATGAQRASDGAVIRHTSNFTIAGNSPYFHFAWGGGRIICDTLTVTLSGSPVFSTAFARAGDGGQIYASGNTYSGSSGASSKRFVADRGGLIYTNGAALTYFPGDTAGTGSGGLLDGRPVWSWYQYTYGATITFDGANGPRQYVTMTGSPAIAAPTNFAPGQAFVFRLIQDGSGGRVPSFNSAFKWAGGVAPTPSSAINAVDEIVGVVDHGGNISAAYRAGIA